MEIAITFAAAPGLYGILAETASKVGEEWGGEFDLRWLQSGEALEMIGRGAKTPSSCPSPQREKGRSLSPWGEGWGEGVFAPLKSLISTLVANQPIDWCIQPAAGRRKRMLIADMDSTIIGQECLDEMADLKGIKPEIAALTERAMRGELDFESALRERIRLLQGLTPGDLQRVLDERITLNPGARTLVGTMKANGAHTVLVSGGFTFFTETVAARAGFADHRANVFLWNNGRLSGVANPILGREAKLAALNEDTAAHGLSSRDVLAVGDGANDLAMIKAAGLGVAYRAKPVVAAEADAQVNHTDLTALLYFQGYSREEFYEAP